MGGRTQVADGPQPLLGLVDGELGREPVAQQPAAAPFHAALGARELLRLVQAGQCLAGECGDGLLPRGRVVGKEAGALLVSQIRAGDRVEFDECVDVGVGDLTGQRAA